MYKHVLQRELTLLPDAIEARAPKRVTTVLSHNEAMKFISTMSGHYKLMFSFFYGCSLRKA